MLDTVVEDGNGEDFIYLYITIPGFDISASLPHKIKHALSRMNIVRLSSLQLAMVTELTQDRHYHCTVDDITETFEQQGPFIDVVVEVHAGPGKNVGSGETVGFLFPVVVFLDARTRCPSLPRGLPTSMTDAYAKPKFLAIGKTREAVTKIDDVVLDLAGSTNIIPGVVYGGTPVLGHMRKLLKGCDILCATPGRLLDLVENRKSIRGTRILSLENVRILNTNDGDAMINDSWRDQVSR